MLRHGIVGFLVLILVLAVPMIALAETEVAVNDNSGISVFGGVGYTTFSDDEFDDEFDLSSGFGFYGGALFEASENISIGGQYERYKTSDSFTDEYGRVDLEMTLKGPVGLVRYNAMPDEPTNLYVQGGIGYYSGDMSGETDDGFSMTVDLESDVGFVFGAGLEQEIQDEISFHAGANYRRLETRFDLGDLGGADDVDMSGFVLNGGLMFSF